MENLKKTATWGHLLGKEGTDYTDISFSIACLDIRATEVKVEKQLPWYEKLRRERKLHGWSQADVAEKIGSDTKTIRRWESGQTFPSPYFRQKLMVLFEKSADELGLIDEHGTNTDVKAFSFPTRWQEDWGEAPQVEYLYGRSGELAKVEQWIMHDHCRVVTVLGIGGIGKTTFATTLAKKVKDTFDYVFWRSLQDAPPNSLS